MAGPLTTSLRGLWVSGLLPPGNGGPCVRAATRKPTKCHRGLTHNSRAGNPKRLRPNCHSCPRGTLEPAWLLHQGEGTQRPQCAKGKGPENPGVAAPLAAAGCRGNCRRDGRARLEHLPCFVGHCAWSPVVYPVRQSTELYVDFTWQGTCRCVSACVIVKFRW